MPTTRVFHAMAKPAGPSCNLRCTYCFYLEKKALYPSSVHPRMSGEVLERYVRDYIDSIEEPGEVAFTWQGGEPTLPGLDFYRRAVELQRRHGHGRRITNSFQTNGLLIDEAWCEFLAGHGFLVGLSLDGPADLHDRHRPTPFGGPSHELVMRAVRLFQRHGVQYNVLACVNRQTALEPLRVYDFLREAGVEFIQFIPIVERPPGAQEAARGLRLGAPREKPAESPEEPGGANAAEVTDWSVGAEDYGRFLTDIFDHWVRRDVGRVFVLNFEWALANFLGQPGTVCHHQPTCGRSLVVEHNGDVYACDHYVYPERRLGNLMKQNFAEMVDAPVQEEFGRAKYTGLSGRCRRCPVLRGCWGGCPKHRFVPTGEGEMVSYLCPGYHHFFKHLGPYLKALGDLLTSGRPASDIMGATLVHLGRGRKAERD